MTKVAVIKADSDRVLVKPNMLEAVEKELCVTTHPWVVTGYFEMLIFSGL